MCYRHNLKHSRYILSASPFVINYRYTLFFPMDKGVKVSLYINDSYPLPFKYGSSKKACEICIYLKNIIRKDHNEIICLTT